MAKNISNGLKIDQMVIQYAKIFGSKTNHLATLLTTPVDGNNCSTPALRFSQDSKLEAF
jgi:hypothetical protein